MHHDPVQRAVDVDGDGEERHRIPRLRQGAGDGTLPGPARTAGQLVPKHGNVQVIPADQCIEAVITQPVLGQLQQKYRSIVGRGQLRRGPGKLQNDPVFQQARAQKRGDVIPVPGLDLLRLSHRRTSSHSTHRSPRR
jgi:hypothetical protein